MGGEFAKNGFISLNAVGAMFLGKKLIIVFEKFYDILFINLAAQITGKEIFLIKEKKIKQILT